MYEVITQREELIVIFLSYTWRAEEWKPSLPGCWVKCLEINSAPLFSVLASGFYFLTKQFTSENQNGVGIAASTEGGKGRLRCHIRGDLG